MICNVCTNVVSYSGYDYVNIGFVSARMEVVCHVFADVLSCKTELLYDLHCV